jgi:hypothetical protein
MKITWLLLALFISSMFIFPPYRAIQKGFSIPDDPLTEQQVQSILQNEGIGAFNIQMIYYQPVDGTEYLAGGSCYYLGNILMVLILLILTVTSYYIEKAQ